jgi:hypothetical protein
LLYGVGEVHDYVNLDILLRLTYISNSTKINIFLVSDWKSQTGSPVRDISFVETKLSLEFKSHRDVTISLTNIYAVPTGLMRCAKIPFSTNISSQTGSPQWDFNTKNA